MTETHEIRSARLARRRRGLTYLTGALVLGAIAWAGYEWLVGQRYEDTDNAYVQGHVIQITPQIGGTVIAIHADETDYVRAGQPLVRLDPSDVNVTLQQAQAQLAQAVRQVRTLYATTGALAAQVQVRQAEIARAEADIRRAADDLQRRQALAGNGAVSTEELNHAQAQLAAARSALAAAQAGAAAAREQLASHQAQTEGTTVEQHPTVQAAAARVREAWLAAQRAALLAPVDGYVARRSVQLGQRVAAGTAVMAIVPLQQVWVEANFKEVQLRNLRIGQPVTLTADVYGRQVEYRGTVAGLGVGTGAAFALLPAQNATGNWIKVVQRVPVRVALDPEQVRRNPLRVGLSMHATVDVRNREGKTLADAPRTEPVAQAPALQAQDAAAEAEVRRIIAANLGRAPRPALAAKSPATARATGVNGSAH